MQVADRVCANCQIGVRSREIAMSYWNQRPARSCPSVSEWSTEQVTGYRGTLSEDTWKRSCRYFFSFNFTTFFTCLWRIEGFVYCPKKGCVWNAVTCLVYCRICGKISPDLFVSVPNIVDTEGVATLPLKSLHSATRSESFRVRTFQTECDVPALDDEQVRCSCSSGESAGHRPILTLLCFPSAILVRVPSKLQCECKLSFIQEQPSLLWGQYDPQVVKSWNKYRVALPTLNQESPTQLYPHLRHTVLESTLMGAYQLKRFHVRVEFGAGPYHISGPKARHEPNPLCISLRKVKGVQNRVVTGHRRSVSTVHWTWQMSATLHDRVLTTATYSSSEIACVSSYWWQVANGPRITWPTCIPLYSLNSKT